MHIDAMEGKEMMINKLREQYIDFNSDLVEFASSTDYDMTGRFIDADGESVSIMTANSIERFDYELSQDYQDYMSQNWDAQDLNEDEYDELLELCPTFYELSMLQLV